MNENIKEKKTGASTFWNQLSKITLPLAVQLCAAPCSQGNDFAKATPQLSSAPFDVTARLRDSNTSVALFRLSSFCMDN